MPYMIHCTLERKLHDMANKRRYTYVIELDAPMWPRKIADELSCASGIFEHLLSVTDLQNSTHFYGATYDVRSRSVRSKLPRFARPLALWNRLHPEDA